jgi:hypothetical protein
MIKHLEKRTREMSLASKAKQLERGPHTTSENRTREMSLATKAKQLEKGPRTTSQNPRSKAVQFEPPRRNPLAPKNPQSPKNPPSPKDTTSPQPYKHIPKTAATSFVNTATSAYVDGKHIHPLCRLVAQSPGADQQSFGDGHVKDVALQIMMGRTDRNQFQDSPEMQAVAEIDAIRGVYKPTQRDFDLSFFSRKEKDKSGNKTPALLQNPSLVNVTTEMHLDAQSGLTSSQSIFGANDKNDWAQRDEVEDYERHSKHRLFKALRRNKQPPPANTPAEFGKGTKRKSFLQIF